MQLFQQRLQQTALMAQQLLAQQMAGQAARQCSSRSSSRPGSVSSSRPASAAAAAHKPSSSQATAGSSANVQLLRGLPGCSSGSGSGSGGLGFRLTPRLAALGVDEPPSAAEVAAYAAYLGMDPQQVSNCLQAGWQLYPARDACT
jgi:hypothetical protein